MDTHYLIQCRILLNIWFCLLFHNQFYWHDISSIIVKYCEVSMMQSYFTWTPFKNLRFVGPREAAGTQCVYSVNVDGYETEDVFFVNKNIFQTYKIP